MNIPLWRFLSRRKANPVGLDTKELLEAVAATHDSSALRNLLRKWVKSIDFNDRNLTRLLNELELKNWPSIEVEKVKAYIEFFSGANARGYARVVQHSLVRRDYALFMTACVYCYLADRFVEGAALIETFQPHEDPTTDWAEYLAYAGYINFAAGKPVEFSLTCFDTALSAGYFSPLLAVNAYPIYFEAGRLERCNELGELIREKCPDDSEAIYALACVELARNNYSEGFRLMEARYSMPEVARYINASLLDKPRWNGEGLKTKKRLLVHGEQGLGDMIMMVRYLPLLREAGAELVIDGRVESHSLLQHNFPDCKFVTGDIQRPVTEPFDYWTGIMSLPHQFGTTASNVPLTDGYLSVPAEQESYWRPRVRSLTGAAKLCVGLAWSGNPGHRADKRRSIPFEVICTLIRRHPEVQFLSLQVHVPDMHPANLINIADELPTLADTAAVIAEVDLLISVDTLAIHLAGALCQSAWLLLPYRYEWRWGVQGETNEWYKSVRVWRQKESGAWPELLEQVSEALYGLYRNKVGG